MGLYRASAFRKLGVPFEGTWGLCALYRALWGLYRVLGFTKIRGTILGFQC